MVQRTTLIVGNSSRHSDSISVTQSRSKLNRIGYDYLTKVGLSDTAVPLVSECEVKEYQNANLWVEWTTIRRPSNVYPKPGGAG